MSSKIRQRSAANPADSATFSANERILKECHSLYADPENGLVKIASSLSLNLLPPRKKIIVLLIGNHSAGKSTFINWYIEEHVQKTGVAIETQGFALVTSGKKRESLTGNATLHLYPHFKPLQKIKGVVDYLTTEISTSRQKKFSLVTFIDTPGLVDGDMKYPFNVNETVFWLGDMADLIFVFFDPIGQALCKRTLDLVEKLNEKHPDRMRFYLSKADEAGHEADRQKVLMQIVQELCKRPGLNRCGFDMPTIYIPNPNKPVRCVNQVEEVCKDIEKTINQTVQNTLNALERDCEHVASLINSKIEQDNLIKKENFRSGGKGFLMGCMGVLFPLFLLLSVFITSASKSLLYSTIGKDITDTLLLFVSPIQQLWNIIPSDYHTILLVSILLLSVLFLLIARWHSRLKPTLSRKQKRSLEDMREYVEGYIKSRKHQLYEEYLRQSVGDHDL